jgi:Glycoside-hydrolase family GH114
MATGWRARLALACVLLGTSAHCGNEPPGGQDRAAAGAGGAAADGGKGSAGVAAGSGGRSGSPAAGGGGAGRAAAGGGGGGAAGVAAGSGGAAAGSGGGGAAGAGSGAPSGWWRPKPGTSWQWQLSGKLDSSFDVAVYDIDMFNTTQAQIGMLHASGRKVICYIDTAYEPDRPDSKQLEPYRGNPIDGWPGQYWLDVRAPAVLEVMQARIELARSKGCDAIEADDVDARSNDPGFPIRAADQQAFIRGLADAAHTRGLAFGLKNDLEEIDALIEVSDFAINEECFAYDECDVLSAFVRAGKAVFQVEYSDDDLDGKAAEICPEANRLNFDTLIKHLDLDAPRKACR